MGSIPDERLAAVVRLVARHHGNQASAAREDGTPVRTFRDQYRMAQERGITEDWKHPATGGVPADLGSVETLLKQGATLDQMTARTGAAVGMVLDEIDRLHTEGRAVVRHGDIFKIEKALPAGAVNHFIFETDKANRIRFGISSDKHYGSKYCREDVISELYQWFADEGIQHVLDAGNWIDGESNFNRYDIKVHGLEAQTRYLAENLPQHEGITTYSVAGDDHEGWYSKREGIDIGRYCESTFRHLGRDDWINMGYMEAFFDIRNANTGAVQRGLVMHPGGGSAYAISYQPQKIVEAFSGGEKPAFLAVGHYHKLMALLVRNVWVIQCGCAQDQTPFMRKKKIDAHIGGAIVEMEQDPETGAIIEFSHRMRRWFNRGYYNDRWSPHGLPTLPERRANEG